MNTLQFLETTLINQHCLDLLFAPTRLRFDRERARRSKVPLLQNSHFRFGRFSLPRVGSSIICLTREHTREILGNEGAREHVRTTRRCKRASVGIKQTFSVVVLKYVDHISTCCGVLTIFLSSKALISRKHYKHGVIKKNITLVSNLLILCFVVS